MLKRWILAMVARKQLRLIVTFCFVSLLYFLTCRSRRNQHHQILFEGSVNDMKYKALLEEHDEQYHHYTTSLVKQILQLKRALHERTRQLQQSLKQTTVVLPLKVEELGEKSNLELERFLIKQLHHAEIHVGTNLTNEYAVVPFESFNLQRVYQLETGLTRHPVQRIHEDLAGVLEAALHILNGPKDRDDPQYRSIYSPRDFFEGIFRTEKDKGTLYDLAFRDKTSLEFRRLVFFRPFAPLLKVTEEVIDTSKILINIIVPLAKEVDIFRQFMHNFREIYNEQDESLHLTVVFFGTEKLDEVKRIIDSTVRTMRQKNFTLIHLNEQFSRGRGFNVGVQAWKKSNVLLFFCDVNVHFTAEFLYSCRMNAKPGKRVFYPIPFSQYNPDIIYGEHTKPPIEKQLVISKNTGFWQDSGFGMTCQYKSDFINIGGFEMRRKSQGREDLHIYRKYLHSNLIVVRAPSRGLLYKWHEKVCTDDLSTDLFKMCMQSKVVNEASYTQMGELFFHQEIENHLNKQHGNAVNTDT